MEEKKQQKHKEITIAYGNEIQLTTVGEKQKKVFLKLSPAFRKRQLRQLKGSALSIFICYALHSDDNGYTWVDDRTVKAETGYSITSEVRRKLIKLGYLYQERLYDDKGRFRDWIYRIFQPVEAGKTFVIRGIKQSTKKNLQGKKTYIEENPISGKNGGIIEEEPIKEEEEPPMSAKADGWDFNKKLEAMGNDKRKHIKIIALYWKYKHYKFDNQEQYESALKRDMRAASNLKGYSPPRITEVMDWLDENVDFRWTLETVWKFIDDDLSELAPIKKTNKYQRYVPAT